MLNPPGHGRYAFDLVGVDEVTGRATPHGYGRLALGLLRARHLYGWGRPVVAPFDGEVVAAGDGERDRDRLIPPRDLPAGFLVRPLLFRGNLAAMAGNHVVVGTPGCYMLLAHLRRGSLQIERGEQVVAGQQLGQVGNSGNTVAPHLHIQVASTADPGAPAAAFRVASYALWTGHRWAPRTGAALPTTASRIRHGPGVP